MNPISIYTRVLLFLEEMDVHVWCVFSFSPTKFAPSTVRLSIIKFNYDRYHYQHYTVINHCSVEVAQKICERTHVASAKLGSPLRPRGPGPGPWKL